MHRVFLTAALCMLAVLFGCSTNTTHVERQAYVLMLGVEQGDAPEDIKISVRIPAASASGDSEDILASAQGPTITTALSILDASTTRLLNYYQLRYIFISEELAQSEQFYPLLTEIAYIGELRQSALLLISKDPPQDMINELSARGGQSLAKTLESLEISLKQNSFIPESNFDIVYDNLISHYRSPAAIYCAKNESKETGGQAQRDAIAGQLRHEGDLPLDVYGAAVLAPEGMQLVYTGYETQFLLMLMGGYQPSYISLVSQGQNWDILLKQPRPAKLCVQMDGDALTLQVELRLQGQVRTCQDESLLPQLQADAQAECTRVLSDMLSRAAQAGLDPAGFGKQLARAFWTTDEFDAYDLPKKLPGARIEVEVSIELFT